MFRLIFRICHIFASSLIPIHTVNGKVEIVRMVLQLSANQSLAAAEIHRRLIIGIHKEDRIFLQFIQRIIVIIKAAVCLAAADMNVGDGKPAIIPLGHGDRNIIFRRVVGKTRDRLRTIFFQKIVVSLLGFISTKVGGIIGRQLQVVRPCNGLAAIIVARGNRNALNRIGIFGNGRAGIGFLIQIKGKRAAGRTFAGHGLLHRDRAGHTVVDVGKGEEIVLAVPFYRCPVLCLAGHSGAHVAISFLRDRNRNIPFGVIILQTIDSCIRNVLFDHIVMLPEIIFVVFDGIKPDGPLAISSDRNSRRVKQVRCFIIFEVLVSLIQVKGKLCRIRQRTLDALLALEGDLVVVPDLPGHIRLSFLQNFSVF